MKKSVITKLATKLEDEKGRILKELTGVSGYKDLGDDVDDNAAEIAQYTNDLSVESELEKTLRDIDKALVRIREGSYGTCKYCGDEIGEKRLEIRPTSSSCIACKKTFTKEA